jgi:hypothetical protein
MGADVGYHTDARHMSFLANPRFTFFSFAIFVCSLLLDVSILLLFDVGCPNFL